MSAIDATFRQDPPLPNHEGASEPLVATGTDLSRLVWRGLILTVVTLGIYRFWYKTDLRRWYWRNTLIGKTPLEYRGTARELLIGFLFALAIVVPLSVLSAILGLFAGELLDVVMRPVAGLAFVFLVQYGGYRSRRYRLTRTVWRGLRFDQAGSASVYAFRSLGWILATIVSLGLLFPFMRRALEGFRIRHTVFGSATGQFDVRVLPLFWRWLVVVIPAVLLVLSGASEIVRISDLEAFPAMDVADVQPVGRVFLGILWPFLLWPMYKAAEFRSFTNGTRLGPFSFVSTFRTTRLYVLHAKLIGVLFAWGLLMLALFIGTAPILAKASSGGPVFSVMLLLPMLLYLVAFIGFSALKEILFNQGYWRHAVVTLSVVNLEAADGIIGSSVTEETATGEGLADALDFGGV
jgi:uncharacterized membrane protein YjgN (DUF898 family)